MHETVPRDRIPGVDAPPGITRGYLAAVMLLTILVHLFAAMDRQILGVVLPAIKADLALSDSQLGILSGLPFALCYSLFGIPVAWLADTRCRRTSVVGVSLIVWSVATVLCGAAGGFLTLFLFRMGVGAGESGAHPGTYSLLSDYVPGRWRARAIAVCGIGAAAGQVAALALGGWSVAQLGWRTTFLLVGAPGILVAILFMIMVREPPRGSHAGSHAGFLSGLAILFRSRAFLLLFFATGTAATLPFSINAWMPSFLIRSHGLTAAQAGGVLAGIFGTIGLAAPLIAAWLADRLATQDRRWTFRLGALCYIVAAPAFGATMLVDNLTATSLLLGVVMILLAGAAPLVAVMAQEVVPALKASAVAAYLVGINLFGHSLGPWFVGFVSDLLAAGHGTESLRLGLLALAPVPLFSGVALWVCGRIVLRERAGA
ncbi:MFS transporter [soil metagenome]